MATSLSAANVWSVWSGAADRDAARFFAAAVPAQQIEIGWWPGDHRYPRAAFFGFAFPPPDGIETAALSPQAGRWDSELGEYLLDWDTFGPRRPAPHCNQLRPFGHRTRLRSLRLIRPCRKRPGQPSPVI